MQGHKPEGQDIDLGLAILGSKEHRLPVGEHRTCKEIAAYCGCSRERIRQIEETAIKKVRFRLKQKLGKDYDLQRNSLE